MVERLQQGQRLCPAHGHGLAQTSLRGGTHSGPKGGLCLPPPSVLQTPAGTSLAKPHPLYEKTTKAAPSLLSEPLHPRPSLRGEGQRPPPLRALRDARSTDPRLPGAPVSEAQPAPASLVLQQN